MQRFVYAKVYCDLLRHPLFRDEPDFYVKLGVGLILEAREHTADGVLRRMTAASVKGLCHLRASVPQIQKCIDYLVAEGWLIPHPDEAYELKDFIERQGRFDTPEAQAARAKTYYDTHRTEILEKRKVSRTVSRENTPVLTQPEVRTSHGDVEVEEEEETEEEKQKKIAARSAPPPAPVQQIEPRLLEGWPPPLLAQVKDALASTRKSGMISLGPWRAFLLRAVGFSPAIRQRAAETYLERNYASEGKAEGYLLGIMRGENGHPQMPMRAMHRAAASLQISEQSKNQAATPGRKFV